MHLVQFPPKMLHKVFFFGGGGGGGGWGTNKVYYGRCSSDVGVKALRF